MRCMKKLNVFLFLSFCFLSVGAQKVYNLASVPESLKNKASVITHLENIQLEVESLDEATLKVQKIFTVINEDGKDALFFNEYSNKYLSLDEAEIKVYDATGKQVEKYKKKEMTTVAVGEGLVEDGYMTYYRVSPSSYPVTVEFNYEQKFKSTLSFPDYRFINVKEAVIESNYTAKVPADISLRYKPVHSTLAPVVSEDGKHKIYKWSVKNLNAIEDEEGSVSRSNRFPYVAIVSNQFSHYGLKGDLSSWKNFGNWINNLYQGLDELPADRQQFFQQIVKDAPNDREKVKRIYQYMQENFRYVSIQLGIGGLKPFSASFTDQKKYGDCKALSNYMKAALKSVGIKSHVAIINAQYNEEPVDPDFPANNFNHVILCVPAKDSIWLECTSSTAEFAKLGTFTENRNALLITEDGGVLVPTPKSESATNSFSSRTVISLENDLSAMTETVMNTTGEFSEMMNDVVKEKRDDQKQIIVLYLGFKQPDDFELTAASSDGKEHTKLRTQIRKLPEFNAGNKYFIKPRVNKIWSSKLPSAENRKLDYYFRYPFEKKDTTIIKLSSGFQPDVLPKEKELKSAYGYYASKSWYSKEDNSIYTSTTLILKKHKVLAADFREVKNFFDEVIQDDSQRVVVMKNENATTEKKGF
jgi:hypothetical protein